MRLERRGDQQDFAGQRVGRHAPLHRFLDVGDDGVDALADLLEDRPGERLRLGDIGVDARIAAQKMPPPSIRRTTPITITNRLRLRPAVPREIMPMPAPMIASGMISQLAQPSNGMKAIDRADQRDEADDQRDEVEHRRQPSIIRAPAAAAARAAAR